MCSPVHFVEHLAADPAVPDTTIIQGLGPVKVVLILRCCVFRNSRGSNRPNPKFVGEIANSTVNAWLQNSTLRLPGMVDVLRDMPSDIE